MGFGRFGVVSKEKPKIFLGFWGNRKALGFIITKNAAAVKNVSRETLFAASATKRFVSRETFALF